MSLVEYAEKFRIKNPYVLEQDYGKLAKFENITEQEKKRIEAEQRRPDLASVSGTSTGSSSNAVD